MAGSGDALRRLPAVPGTRVFQLTDYYAARRGSTVHHLVAGLGPSMLRNSANGDSPAGSRRRWNVELGARARRGFALTVTGTTLLTGLFFIGYFYVQRHPAHMPTIMPRTKLDLMIP